MQTRGGPAANFDQQSAVVLHCAGLLGHCPQVLIEVIRALIDDVPLVAIVRTEEQRRDLITLLVDWGLPAHNLTYVRIPAAGLWLRDYAPAFMRSPDGRLSVITSDPDPARPDDALAASHLAGALGLPVTRIPLSLAGGNLLANGHGLAVMTQAVIAANQPRRYDGRAVAGLLHRHCGISQCVMLKPLRGERTGNVDRFATFVTPDTIVVGQYDADADPLSAATLDENASILARLRMLDGRNLRVVRVPMPPNRGGIWRSYTNVIFANGKLLMPTYPTIDPRGARAAAQVYESLLPDCKVIPIDCDALIEYGGALRCVSTAVPTSPELSASSARSSGSA